MHARRAARDPKRSSLLDWALHMAEEDVLLFPIFAMHHPVETERLYADHDAFRWEIRRYGEIRDLPRMRRHSELEDALAIEVAPFVLGG